MKIHTKTTTVYEMSFLYKDDPGAGFGFPCDKDGAVDTCSLEDIAFKNYKWCEAHRDLFHVHKDAIHSKEKYGTCDRCGSIILIYPDCYGEFRCPSCGQLYNAFGQSLDNSAWDASDYFDDEVY